MVYTQKGLSLFVLLTICLIGNSVQVASPKPDIIVIKGLRNAYLPFSAIKSPAFEITNDRLNVSVTDSRSNLFQINGIPIANLKKGVYPASSFQTVIMMAHGETYTDDGDTNNRSLIEITCDNNNSGSPISIGIKTTVRINKNNHRVYATLSGIIPTKQYQSTN